jgi:FkbM family methyltransferase
MFRAGGKVYMLNFLSEYCSIFDGQTLNVPDEFTRIKIDVGLSSNAPQSEIWLSRDPSLFVFGFEPISENLEAIRSGTSIWPVKLDPQRIGKSFSLIPCALVAKPNSESIQMFVTKSDTGCSSLFEPKELEVKSKEMVRSFTLNEFLDFFPFDQFPVIEHLKVDVQGADFGVIKGASKYLSRILFVTIEIDLNNYHNSINNRLKIAFLLASRGFVSTNSTIFNLVKNTFDINATLETDDPTYFNIYKFYKFRKNNFDIYQRG